MATLFAMRVNPQEDVQRVHVRRTRGVVSFELLSLGESPSWGVIPVSQVAEVLEDRERVEEGCGVVLGYDESRDACVVFFDGGPTRVIVRLRADNLRQAIELEPTVG